jgi:serine/threonine protein kinase
VTILEKNVAYLEKKLAEDAARSSSSGPSTEPVHEVIFPRLISDAVQRNLPIVREKCRCVNLTFAHSESKSKQFSRICLEGSLASDVEKAKEHLWSMLLQLCAEASAPTAPNKIPRHLGFLGGALRPFQFRLLCDSAASPGNHHHHHRSSSRSLATTSTDACEEDLNGSPFIKSFESTQQCTVWVQAREDKGRVNSQNRVVDEPTPDEPRKIYFGCRPSEVARLGVLIQTRASELARGVKYLSLGADRVYQPLMMKNGGDFFKFVRQVTGATVTVDPMTGDHLRIDGRLAPENAVDVQLTEEIQTMAEGERASLAEEIVRLQIERYRDLCAREYPWIFGRDWTLTAVSATDSTDSRQPAGSIGTLDRATVGHCGVEIAETVSNLGLPGSIAGHAAIILYRFVNCTEEFTTNFKSREAVVACVFLANKAQKSAKWKRLDAVLEAGYKAFYPGSPFDRNKEEVIVLEERVITAEKEILEKVDYDVFWNDVEWINIAATGSGKMSSDFVKQVFDITFSGPILSAGAEVWLKYGVEYVFAAAAAFLKANLSDVLSALSLIPLKVSQAAEILAISAKLDRLSSTKRAFHPLLEGGRERLEKQLPRVKETCLKLTTDAFLKSSTETSSMASAAEQRYRIIGERSRRRQMIRGVPRNLVNESVLPIIDGIATESSCSIYIGESSEDDKEDIVFDGSWRAVALADHLLRTRVQGVAVLPQPVDTSGDLADCPKLQAKSKPGLLNSNDILCAEGWDGTMPAETGKDSKDPNPQLGGKSCIAGKISESAMDEAGLRWWISPKNGPSPSGSIAEMCRIRAEQSSYLDVLVNMTKSLVGHTDTFPLLSSRKSGSVGECSLPLSMQQWPPEKVSRAENKNEEKLNKKSKEKPVEMGFSAAALQELQLLKQLHGTISTPQGHPNFVLPIAISFPRNDEQSPVTKKTPEHNGNSAVFSPDDQIFSLFRSNEENAKVADREKKVKDCPNLIFSPAPFVMHRFMSRKLRRTDDVLIRPTLLAAWFHDILSALVHLHSSHVILRTVQSDQIWIDQAGVAKIGTLYRSTTLPVDERKESPSPLELALSAKKKKKKDENDIPSNSYVAPEILLGSPKYSKESDVWAVGCLLANLLLSKPLFSGKDRQSLLTSQFKVVGTPSVNNYNESVKFPHYVKPEKKYHRGLVDKALEHLLKDQASQHARAIDLIARMLCLDPRERCTAEEALGHDFMNDYLEKCRSYTNRHQYVADWLALKERMTQMKDEEKNKEKSRKRKEMMVAAFKTATGDDDDDLYDLEEIMEEGPKKKSKS